MEVKTYQAVRDTARGEPQPNPVHPSQSMSPLSMRIGTAVLVIGICGCLFLASSADPMEEEVVVHLPPHFFGRVVFTESADAHQIDLRKGRNAIYPSASGEIRVRSLEIIEAGTAVVFLDARGKVLEVNEPNPLSSEIQVWSPQYFDDGSRRGIRYFVGTYDQFKRSVSP